MASSWLNFFQRKKKLENNEPATSRWAGERMWEHQNEYLLCIGRVDDGTSSSRACSWLNLFNVFFPFFFLVEKIEPATRRWGSYEALSQLRGAEPATKHWASYVSLSQQGSFELARRQWASKVALSFIIYIPMQSVQSQPYNILNLGQNNCFEGDTYLWAGAGMWKVTFDIINHLLSI